MTMIALYCKIFFWKFILDILLFCRDRLLFRQNGSQEHMKMRIFLNVNDDNALLVVYYAGATIWISIFQHLMLDKLERSQKSVFMFRMPNVTLAESHMYYGIPHDDCRCSVVSTQPCLTHSHIKMVHILPLVLFVSEIYLIRELLSLTGEGKYLLVNILWIVSMFIFIGILVIIYRIQYYYSYTVSILFHAGYLLFYFVGYEVGLDGYRNRSSPNNNVIVNTERSATIDNWDESEEEIL
jgi:hypothetical protein